jgi:hypothetical protein
MIYLIYYKSLCKCTHTQHSNKIRVSWISYSKNKNKTFQVKGSATTKALKKINKNLLTFSWSGKKEA